MTQDHNSIEAVAARASQQDPLIMYLVVRESLNMSIGKTAAQCAHASQMLLLKYIDLKFQDKENPKLITFNQWLQSSFRKVVLRADDKEFNKLKFEYCSDSMVVVVDSGLTEIEAGSETVIGLFPIYKSQVPKMIKRLQVLK